jgi:hypothetical protein
VIGRDGIWPLKGRTEAPSPVERQVLDLIEENPGIPEFGVVSRFRLKRPEVRRCIGDLVWNGLVVDRDGYLHLRSESDGPPVITNLRFQGDRASRAALAAERSKNVAARMAGLIRGGRYPAKRLPRVRAKRRDDNSRIKIPAIQHLVAIEYSVSIEAMVGSRRSANVVLPRHIAMYLCNIVAGCSLSIIGMEFGDRDHTTVLHAVHKMEKKIKRSPALARKIKALSEQIGSGDAENVESCAASA